MHKNLVLGAALMAASLPALLLSVSPGSANASQVTSTVETYSGCKWELSGVPGNVNMVPASVTENAFALLPEGTKYVGEKLWLAGFVESMTLALTGEDAPGTGISNQMTACSFYNESSRKYPKVEARLNPDETDWMNAYYIDADGQEQEDPKVSFQLKPATMEGDVVTEEGNPLGINPYSEGLVALALGLGTPEQLLAAGTLTSDDLQCIDSRIGGAKSIMRGHNHAHTNKMILWVTGVDDVYEAGQAPRCSTDTLFMTHIPAISEIPAAPGSTYTFRGPEVEFTLDTQSTVPTTPVNPANSNTDYQAYTVDAMLGN